MIDNHSTVYNTLPKHMLLPIRSSTVPSHPVYGYSINQDTQSRFPGDGSYAGYTFNGYQDSFEVMDTAGEAEATDIQTLDFGPKRPGTSSWNSFNKCMHYKRDVHITDGGFAFFSRESGVKWRNFNIPILSFWDDNYCNLALNPVLAFGTADNPILGIPRLWYGLADGGCFSSDQGLYSIACENMLPGIRPALSLINDIYELKDVKTLPHTVDAIKKAMSSLGSLLKGEAKYLFSNKARAGRKTLKSILNAGADVYLQDNFNVQPLLKSILSAYHASQNVDSKLKQLAEHSRQRQKVHWGRSLSGFDQRNDTLHTTGRPSDSDADVSLQRVVTYATARFSATLEYFFEMPEGSYSELRIRGIKDYLGLTPSLQTIWNGIPWSFVVDWVIAVGPWLGQFTGRQLEIRTHISKAGWSVKVDRRIQTFASLTGPVGDVHEVSYFRTPQDPPLISSLQTSGINSKEFTLGAALGITHK